MGYLKCIIGLHEKVFDIFISSVPQKCHNTRYNFVICRFFLFQRIYLLLNIIYITHNIIV